MTQTHDAADDGFHEIQLSGKQLVFLFMSTTVILVVVFLCGVLVGRGVRTGSELDTPVDSAAGVTDPVTTPDAGIPAADAPPQPVAEPKFEYDKRLQQPNPKEQLSAPEPATEQPPTKPAAEQAAQTPAEQPAAQPPSQKTAVRAEADVPTSGRPGVWLIQVHALRNRDAASAIVKRLIAKGYPAFLPNPARGEPAIYRVQIGRYKDRSDADQVARRLAREEQLRPEVKR